MIDLPHIVHVNVSGGGVPKHPVPAAHVYSSGLEGDAWNDKKHHGLPGQAVCLFSTELIEELRQEGFPLFPGALGENLTTRGLEYRQIRLGQIYQIGKEVKIRITKIRTPCRTIAVYGEGILRATYDSEVKGGNVNSPKWGRSGYYAEVIQEGTVRPGDPIILLTS